MEDRDEERKSTTSLWLDGLKGFKEEDPAPKDSPKKWIQFSAFSVVFKVGPSVFPMTPVNAMKMMVNQIHHYLINTGIPNIKIKAAMTPDVKIAKKQVVTVFYGYAIDNPENNPVLPVKLFRPVTDNMTQGCKKMGMASWKYAGLLDNSDLVRKSLEFQIKKPFSVVLGLNPTKSEYNWFDGKYKVVKSETVYKEFPKDKIAPV